MVTGRELEARLLQGPGERSLRGSLRDLLYGTVAAILISLYAFVSGENIAQHFLGYVLAGNGISFFGWGAERLWYSTISKMVNNPFSWIAYLTRVPFWYLAGGIGFTLGWLVAKKLGMAEIQDIPVKHLFDAGGKIECCLQLPLQVVFFRSLTNLKNN